MAITAKEKADASTIIHKLYMYKEVDGTKDEGKDLVNSYFDANGNVYSIVSEHMEVSDLVVIPNASQTKLFLFPGEFSGNFKYTKSEIKNSLGSKIDDLEYYLAMTIILILLSEFYSREDSNTSKVKDFLTFDRFKSIISERLQSASDYEEKNKKEDYEFNFTRLKNRFNNLLDDTGGKNTIDTKNGFINKILILLRKEGLIKRNREGDDLIEVTDRLTTFMDNHMLDLDRYDTIDTILKGGA